MIYSINKVNYKTFEKFGENKLPGRSYFIPFSNEEELGKTNSLTERYQSDRVQLLSGNQWGFHYYKTAEDLPELLDTSKTVFDAITVPSTWQRTGYEAPCYLNAEYEFDEKVPNVPARVSVGVYRRAFHIRDTSKNYLITFLGVISSLDLYVNGRYVGYSEGAHNTAEFNINSFLTEGENELLCVVYKWSTATYLECQDMFRENGIFRDVYITQRENAYMRDISVTYRRQEDGTYGMRVLTTVRGEDAMLSAVLRQGDVVVAQQEQSMRAATDLTFKRLQVTEWNAEIPTVYELILSIRRGGETLECTRLFVGFKTIKIEGEVFRFNGQKIKIKGVNHHDTNPNTGYVMSVEDMRTDIALMKAFNVNAVRTSHYPPDPTFLTLCDLYGLYVIDEADIETHGVHAKPYPGIHSISNNTKWANHYLDRVRRMYERDKNHPSITMWSLGNESGGYKCQDRCYNYLKDVSPEIPVHYEGVRGTIRKCYDVMSEMYTSYQRVGDIGANKTTDLAYKGKPFFLCEYAHAMGVGPGGLEDYMKAFYASDKLLGGCIWEWADHVVTNENGPYRYTYGGDHGEKRHSGSFCVDGLFYPDRRPHTGALEMRAVYRPLRAKEKQAGIYLFKNTNCFKNADDIEIRWELLKEGTVISGGSFSLDLDAGEVKSVQITHPAAERGQDYHINFIYLNKNSGQLIAKEQLELQTNKEMPALSSAAATLQQSGDTFTVAFEDGCAVFNKESGRMEQYVKAGREYFNQSPQSGKKGLLPCVFRAPLDNDGVKGEWMKNKLEDPIIKVKRVEAVQDGSTVVVKTLLSLKASRMKTTMQMEVGYTVDGKGTVLVESRLVRLNPTAKNLGRFGLAVELPGSFDTVAYYGRGEEENLSDLLVHTAVGRYESKVAALAEPYVKPQESGFHTEVRSVRFTDEKGEGLEFVHTGKPFTFHAAHHTSAQLADWKHIEDVKQLDTTCVNIDGFLRGAGSNSCGPVPGEPHVLDQRKPHAYSFLMRPVCRA